MLRNEKGAKNFYDIFVSDKYEKPKSERKWEEEFNMYVDSAWWKKQNTLVKTMTDDISLRWFHYRILHRIIGTNYLLHKIGIFESNMCTFCNEQPETICHLFYSCVKTTEVWDTLSDWIYEKTDKRIDLNAIDVIIGKFGRAQKTLNLIICIVKKYLYVQKLNKRVPNGIGMKKFLQEYHRV